MRDRDFLTERFEEERPQIRRIAYRMLGTVDDVNRANAQTAAEAFVAWGSKPRLDRGRGTLRYKPAGVRLWRPARFHVAPGGRRR